MSVAASTVMPVQSNQQVAWDQTRAQLLGFVRRRVESLDAAEDIVQDVLERIHRTDLSMVSNLQGWLYQASRNAIVDHYRRRRQLVSLDESAVPAGAEPGVDSPEPAAAVQELAGCLRPLIEQLPEEYRAAISRVDLDGETHHAVASATGVSTSGMKSRVQRGRRKLAALLQECCAVETTPSGSIVDYSPRGDSCATCEPS